MVNIVLYTYSEWSLSALKLYFNPQFMRQKLVIKVKTQEGKGENSNTIDNLFVSGSENIDQDLAILQTYHLHKDAIEKLNINVQYFVEDRYKRVELFYNSPILIDDINISDDMVGKYITLTPQKYGFYIESKSKKYKNFFEYGKEVKTDWFKFRVVKKVDFDKPIYIKLNGSNRNIYENIIKKT